MNIYLLEQNENTGYDTFDAMIVIAKNPIEAKLIHPFNDLCPSRNNWVNDGSWASKPENVKATLIGKQDKRYTPDSPIICSSFNAG